MPQTFEFHDPERFVIGTVGVPGEREFFLQVKGESRGRKVIASFKLEKSQAAALADRSLEILRELRLISAMPESDLAPLETPVEAESVLGLMSLTWLEGESRFLFEAQGLPFGGPEEILDETDPLVPPIVRVKLPPEDLLLFAKRTEMVVRAGRQPCMFCGGAMNPGGHLCPRSNGYRRQG